MKLIQTKDYLLLIDEEAKVGKYVWDKEHNYMRENVSRNNITDFDIEIIAYRPLTKEAKELDLPLLPNPFDKQIDEVTHLKNLGHECFIQMKKLNPSGGMKEFIRMAVEFGYKAAQQSKQFSLEDVKKAIDMAREEYTWTNQGREGSTEWYYSKEQIIQSLSTQQLPSEFIPEYEYYYHSSEEFYKDAKFEKCSKEQYDSIKKEIPTCPVKVKLKTITNSEGKEEIVGSYKY